MTKEEVFDGLKEILSNVRPKTDLSSVSYESRLINDLGIDSLSMLLISLAAENKFHMQFASGTPPFETVGDVCDYILNAISK